MFANSKRDSPIAERSARRSVLVEMLSTIVRITQTNRVLTWEVLSATVTFYSAICMVLYVHRCCYMLNCRTTNKRCFVSCARKSPVHTSNNVEATGNFVERTKFQRKTRSTLLPFLATKLNVASTLLLVWTGLNAEVSRMCYKQTSTKTNVVDDTAYTSVSALS